jgi:GDP-4-dehydro-6-deoxy-D-mannose reductase
VLRGSAEKIEAATGWRPRIPFDQTLADLLEYWRRRTPARSR